MDPRHQPVRMTKIRNFAGMTKIRNLAWMTEEKVILVS
jgi:hypothetical protein